MKNSVMIKSFQSGIALHLNPETEFDQLLEEVGTKFRQAQNFFKDAKMALTIEGRQVNTEEEKRILEVIGQNSSLDIVCLICKNKEDDQVFVKAVQRAKTEQLDNIGRFYRGTLKNGQTIETESSIVILGDVYPGSCVTATKDIVIIGSLCGEAYAGSNGETGHFIAALEMSPEKMKIGDFRYRPSEKHKWGIRPKVQPKIAYVKDRQIVMEPITKDLLEFLTV